MSLLQSVDSAQERITPTSVAVATFKKVKDDQSTNMAAMIAFWAFFSIFPLLMVLVTVLGWVLPASDKDNVLGHIGEHVPAARSQDDQGPGRIVVAAGGRPRYLALERPRLRSNHWFYLQAVVTLLGAQLNVVLKERLHRRSVVDAPQTEADHRALQAYAEERAYHPEEKVRTDVARGREPRSA